MDHPSIAERLHEAIPDSDLIMVPETGHFAMEDSPREVAATLFEFFTGYSKITARSASSDNNKLTAEMLTSEAAGRSVLTSREAAC
jgi:hypothetical protein